MLPLEVNGLHSVHLLMPSRVDNAVKLSTVGNVQSAQSVSKLSVNAINRCLYGNKTLHMTSLSTGKRFKREITLKFSEGSAETYESFRSQFNIHRKILGWDDYRTAVELYMSIEGKATLKLRRSLKMQIALGTSPGCGKLWIMHFCLSTIVSGNTGNTDDLKHILTYRDYNRRHRFKDESCTYCNKK